MMDWEVSSSPSATMLERTVGVASTVSVGRLVVSQRFLVMEVEVGWKHPLQRSATVQRMRSRKDLVSWITLGSVGVCLPLTLSIIHTLDGAPRG